MAPIALASSAKLLRGSSGFKVLRTRCKARLGMLPSRAASRLRVRFLVRGGEGASVCAGPRAPGWA
eukprot:3035125-Pyramimonas_sp.AAC.1